MVKRVAIGVYNDGFIHAGNLAYLSIVALFPFFIVAAAVAHLLGQSQDAQLDRHQHPAPAAARRRCTLREPIQEVLTVRTGTLLWLGAIVGLWTATSFIETIRDILRRAYGVKYCAPFWEYRLGSILLILGAVAAADDRLRGERRADARPPSASSSGFRWRRTSATTLGLYRLVPAATLFFTFYVLFYRAHARALSQARLPEMAGRLAHHRLVAGDGRDPAPCSACSAATAAPTAASPA